VKSHLLALLGAHHIFHVSGLRVNVRTFQYTACTCMISALWIEKNQWCFHTCPPSWKIIELIFLNYWLYFRWILGHNTNHQSSWCSFRRHCVGYCDFLRGTTVFAGRNFIEGFISFVISSSLERQHETLQTGFCFSTQVVSGKWCMHSQRSRFVCRGSTTTLARMNFISLHEIFMLNIEFTYIKHVLLHICKWT
jgi:hypothetical protein